MKPEIERSMEGRSFPLQDDRRGREIRMAFSKTVRPAFTDLPFDAGMARSNRGGKRSRDGRISPPVSVPLVGSVVV
jgi:hypothetical protein